jgi:predicted transcriptional regulator
MTHGEKRTCARNNRALLIEVHFKKKTCMRRSKLEMYVDILKVLAHWGPLKITPVMYKANLNYTVLEEYFAFLIKQGLIEVKTVRRERKIYMITQPGITVLRQFRELKGVLPIVEETGNKTRHQGLYLF